MTMLTIEHCRRVAAGTPDTSSGEFRSAVAAVAAWMKNAVDPCARMNLADLHSALLAHGEPVKPRKPTREELSAIRREASARGLVARAKSSLRKRVPASRSGIVNLSDKKPAVFDAALEMIEDGEIHCTHFATSAGSDGEVRSMSVTWAGYIMPAWATIRECPWKSRRQQEGERI